MARDAPPRRDYLGQSQLEAYSEPESLRFTVRPLNVAIQVQLEAVLESEPQTVSLEGQLRLSLAGSQAISLNFLLMLNTASASAEASLSHCHGEP